MATAGNTSPTSGTKTDGKNSAPATCPTSLTAASAGAVAVRVVKAAAMATLFDLVATCLPLLAALITVSLALLAFGTLTATRDTLLAAHTFILVLSVSIYRSVTKFTAL